MDFVWKLLELYVIKFKFEVDYILLFVEKNRLKSVVSLFIRDGLFVNSDFNGICLYYVILKFMRGNEEFVRVLYKK